MGSLPAYRGTLVINSVADPAVASAFMLLTPPGVQARIISVHFTLTCDANVADRLVYYEIRDATRLTTRVQTTQKATANQTQYFSFWSGFSGAPTKSIDRHLFPFPNNYIQEGLVYVSVFTENVQVGDQFSGIVYYAEEWIGDQ